MGGEGGWGEKADIKTSSVKEYKFKTSLVWHPPLGMRQPPGAPMTPPPIGFAPKSSIAVGRNVYYVLVSSLLFASLLFASLLFSSLLSSSSFPSPALAFPFSFLLPRFSCQGLWLKAQASWLMAKGVRNNAQQCQTKFQEHPGCIGLCQIMSQNHPQ